MSDRLTDITSWQALDSRGRPTVGVAVVTADGSSGRAVVPSGASTGAHEARELRDGGVAHDGMGVLGAVANVREKIAPMLIGSSCRDQATLDATLEEIDGTDDLAVLGANAVLAVSLATRLAAADHDRLPLYAHLDQSRELLLPRPMFNIVSGGAHAGGLVDIQDVLAIPLRASTFAEALELGGRVRAGTAAAMRSRGMTTDLVADEGGLAGAFATNRDALATVFEGVERAGLRPGWDVGLAIDVAATQLYEDGHYVFASEGRTLTSEDMVAEVASWVDDFALVSVEDPLAEDDWAGWQLATRTLGTRVQLIGDDVFVTNVKRLRQGREMGVANAVLVKPNQIGTVTRTADLMAAARAANYATVVSARSGDTEDYWLADLAVGWRAGQIKVGSTTRSERTAKWNRLLQIEAALGTRGHLSHG